MNTYKKIILGLSVIAAALGVFLSGQHKVLAIEGFTKPQIKNATFKFGSDLQTISAKIGGKTVEFKMPGSLPQSSGNIACPGATGSRPPGCIYYPAEAFSHNDLDYLNLPANQRTFCNNPQQLRVIKGGAASDWQMPVIQVSIGGSMSPTASNPIAFNNINAGSTDGGSCVAVASSQKTIKFNPAANKVTLVAPKDGSTVKGKVTVSVNASSSTGITGVGTSVEDPSVTDIIGATSTTWVKGLGPKSWSGSGTWDTSNLPDGKYTITSVLHQADGSTQTDTATVTTNNGNPPIVSGSESCDANFTHAFSWILCPAMDLADSAGGQFNSFVDNQLCFNTGSSSSTGGVVCKSSNNNLTDNVKQAWNIFKNIASALLVIAMLVMVISQAIGGGPFDAYTVRKMLPKLVAAVILMQLSWVLIKWSIDLTNDVGTSIANLMMAPFGGTGTLSLKHLVGVDLNAQSAATSAAAATFAFFGVLAASLIVSVPGLALMALYVVMALLTAFIVLLLRKMLIILLVILTPVALVLWIMPGTERYWSQWKDNFIKLLIMFPMIEAFIAAGRIFAYIASGNSTTGVIFNRNFAVIHIGHLAVPYFATFTNFVDLAIIIGAWFAPYFLLPQTFKWGGTALGAIGKGVPQALEKMGGKQAKEYLDWRQSLSPWKQARAARRARQEIGAKTDFYEGLGVRGVTGGVRRARLRGVFRPTPGGLREERALTGSIVRGGAQRAEEEALKEAAHALDHELDTDPLAIADHDQYVVDIARAGVGATVHGRARSEADWRAAVDKSIQYGGPNNRVVEELHQQYLSGAMGEHGRAAWEKVLNSNAPSLLSKFPFYYKDRDYSQRDATGALGDLDTTVTQLSADAFTKDGGVEGEAIETTLGHLSTLVREGATPGATAAQVARGTRAQEHITTMYSLFNQAITSDSTSRRINPAAARAMLSGMGADPTGLARINGGRTGRGTGVPEIDAAVIAHTITTSGDPDMPTAVGNIMNIVRPDGTLR